MRNIATLCAAISEFGAIDHSDSDVDEFLSRVSYLHVDAKGSAGWSALKSRCVMDMCAPFISRSRLLYLGICRTPVCHEMQRDSRIVVEKPWQGFETARALNNLGQTFPRRSDLSH